MNNSATIIVIEDEAQIRRFLRTSLASEGYQVIEADTGRQGMTEAATRKPDLIILDLGLPDTDGVEVIKGIRAWSSVPIIILSARSQESDKDSCPGCGCNRLSGQTIRRGRIARTDKSVIASCAFCPKW